MPPHVWAWLGETVSDTTHRMFYRGEEIKEAYYRGEKIWEAGDDAELIIILRVSGPLTVLIRGENISFGLNDENQRSRDYAVSYPFSSETQRVQIDSQNDDVVYLYGNNVTTLQFETVTGTLYSNVTEILSPLGRACINLRNTNLMFWGASITSIPKNLFENTPNVTEHTSTFSRCEKLLSIPSGLFSYCKETTRMETTFAYCHSLTKIYAATVSDMPKLTKCTYLFMGCEKLNYIGNGFLMNLPSLTSVMGCFQDCIALETVENYWFFGCPNIENVGYLFDGCVSLRKSPTNLGSSKLATANYTFRNCSSLASIPSELFYNAQNIAGFDSTFAGCSSIIEIPSQLFRWAFNAKNFHRTFYKCTSLVSVPVELFDYISPDADDFRETFGYCEAVTSAVPDLWNRFTELQPYQHYDCFGWCFKAANRKDIPAGW